MIKIMPIGSGSSGNCCYLEINGKKLLIDAGLNTKAIVSALGRIGVTPPELDGVIITHTHSDHTSALPVLKKRLTCRFFMSELSYSKLFLPNTEILPFGRTVPLVEGIRATAFETFHDCPGSLGFRLDYDGGSFGYATDLGVVTEEIQNTMTGCSDVVLECNHDVKMLLDGPYPYPLKRRILSDNGHLSNEACAQFARHLVLNGTRTVMLAHLSRENNTPEVAYQTVSAALEDLNFKPQVFPPSGGKLMVL